MNVARLIRFIGCTILLTAVVWQPPAPAIAQTACGEYAVATAPQTAGSALTDNVVTLTTASGELASGVFDQPQTVEPSPRPGVALLRSYGGILGLMDVASGEVTLLKIPESEQSLLTAAYPTIRNADNANFMLLASGPAEVWLVDLTSGDAVDLATLDGETQFIDTAQISPDGSWLLYSSGQSGYVFSLERPGGPSPIDNQPLLPYPNFDARSNVIYAVGTGASVTIRSLDPDTGQRIDVVAAPDVHILPLQTGDPLWMMDSDDVLIYGHDDRAPRPVYDWSEGPSAVLLDQAGAHMLISETIDGAAIWTWVELATGTSVEIPELSGMSPVLRSTRQDSAFFQPTARIEPGVPGAAYRTFDLTTGTVTTVLEQDSTEIYQTRTAGDADGRYSLINAVSPGSGRIWLVDGKAGTAKLVATSLGNANASISPDGCQLAVGIYDTIGQGRTSAVSVESMADGSPVSSVPDALLLGWAAIPSAG